MEIKKAAIVSYIGLFLNIITGFLFTPWLIKTLGTSDYALYTLIGVFLSYFVMDFGLSDVTTRFVAKYKHEDEEKVKQFLGISIRLYLIITGVLCIVFSGVYFLLDDIFLKLTAAELVAFKTIFIIASVFSVLLFPFTPVNGVLIAYEKFFVLKIADIFSKIGSTLLIMVFLLLGYSIFAVVVINSLVAFITACYKTYVFYKDARLKPLIRYKNKQLLKEIFNTSGWFTLIGICKRLLINFSPTLLGIFSGSKQIAIFSISMLIESYVNMFSSAINGFFTSKIARITSQTNDRKEVLVLMIKAGRIQLLIVGLIYIGLVVLGKEFILLWMNKDFEMAYYIILLITAHGFFTLTQDVANSLLYIENEIKYRAILYVASVLFSLGLSIVLLPKLGALGSGIAIGVSFFIFHFLAINWVFYKKMNLDVFSFFKEVYWDMSLGLIISFIFALLLNYFFPASNLIYFLGKAVTVIIFYAFIMWFFAMNNFEKNLVKSTLKI